MKSTELPPKTIGSNLRYKYKLSKKWITEYKTNRKHGGIFTLKPVQVYCKNH